MIQRHKITSPRTAAKCDIAYDAHEKKLERKIHSNSCARRSHVKLLRWTAQRSVDRMMQSIFLVFIIYIVLTSVVKYQSSSTARLIHPPVVGFDADNNFYEVTPIKDENYHSNRKVEALSEVEIEKDRSGASFEEGDCKAMHPWQVEYNINCNCIHEIDLFGTSYVGGGAYRLVWRMRDGDGSDAVVKTFVFRKDLNTRAKQRHQVDANIYAALQSSVHIPSIYSYCKSTAKMSGTEYSI